uniref:DDE Tnp4 domain-containing protein n=1 Tax=Trichuris muris TaxID=70415 RepID=A0A5S6QSW5_TRIMR
MPGLEGDFGKRSIAFSKGYRKFEFAAGYIVGQIGRYNNIVGQIGSLTPWFEGYKVNLCTAVKFIYAWSHGYTTIRFCYDQLDMCKKSAEHWNESMRGVAAEVLMRQPLVIGGPGLTVEVDETVYSKRKYQRGRLYPQQ